MTVVFFNDFDTRQFLSEPYAVHIGNLIGDIVILLLTRDTLGLFDASLIWIMR